MEKAEVERLFGKQKTLYNKDEVHVIKKVKILHDCIDYYAKEMELTPDDLVILGIVKIKGSPINFLMKRCGLMTKKDEEEMRKAYAKYRKEAKQRCSK